MSKHLTTSQIISCLDGIIASNNRAMSVDELDNYYFTVSSTNELLHDVIDSLFASREAARARALAILSRRSNSM